MAFNKRSFDKEKTFVRSTLSGFLSAVGKRRKIEAELAKNNLSSNQRIKLTVDLKISKELVRAHKAEIEKAIKECASK